MNIQNCDKRKSDLVLKENLITIKGNIEGCF